MPFCVLCATLAALGVISNPLGALLSGLLVELLGRRTAIQLTAIPYVVGWVCLALARHFTLLCVGRFISGEFPSLLHCKTSHRTPSHCVVCERLT